jgi:hypothetical protein
MRNEIPFAILDVGNPLPALFDVQVSQCERQDKGVAVRYLPDDEGEVLRTAFRRDFANFLVVDSQRLVVRVGVDCEDKELGRLVAGPAPGDELQMRVGDSVWHVQPR